MFDNRRFICYNIPDRKNAARPILKKGGEVYEKLDRIRMFNSAPHGSVRLKFLRTELSQSIFAQRNSAGHPTHHRFLPVMRFIKDNPLEDPQSTERSRITVINLKELSIRIGKRRRSLCMTQKQMADLLGVTPQAVSKWERALAFPDPMFLDDLADTLEMSLDELLTGNTANEHTDHKNNHQAKKSAYL